MTDPANTTNVTPSRDTKRRPGYFAILNLRMHSVFSGQTKEGNNALGAYHG